MPNCDDRPRTEIPDANSARAPFLGHHSTKFIRFDILTRDSHFGQLAFTIEWTRYGELYIKVPGCMYAVRVDYI